MPTTQSEDPNERIDHPRWYNGHESGIECIELIRHLPSNLANAVKYVWRCGLKTTETPLRDLKSARWYTQDEEERIDLFELEGEPKPKTDVVWRALAHEVIRADFSCTLGRYLEALLRYDFEMMYATLDDAIADLERPDAVDQVGPRSFLGPELGIMLRPGTYFTEVPRAACCSTCSGVAVSRFAIDDSGVVHPSGVEYDHFMNCPKVQQVLR